MGEQAGLSWLAHPKPREGQIEMIASCGYPEKWRSASCKCANWNPVKPLQH